MIDGASKNCPAARAISAHCFARIPSIDVGDGQDGAVLHQACRDPEAGSVGPAVTTATRSFKSLLAFVLISTSARRPCSA